jgi:glycine/D-amino acid oxidase-like deaminating enzyme
MKNTREKDKETTWTIKDKKSYPRLGESFETDVCVIGGGIAGMLIAYTLFKKGKRVALVEREEIGHGVTELTTAFLTASIDTDFADLIKSFGPIDARAIVESHSAAIDLIEVIAREEGISCEFERCSNYLYAISQKDFSIVDEECDAAQELGLDATLHPDGAALGFKNFGYMEIKNQGKFHPLKFILGLADVLERGGARIFEDTEAEDIVERDFGRSVRAHGHSIQAKWVVSAVYEPFHEPLRQYFKKGTYKTYLLEAHTEWKIPVGIYEDTENPYHYIRVDKEGEGLRLLVGGEDHREEIPIHENRNWNALEEYLESLIPKESFTLRRRWTGPILEPVDGLAFIGPASEKDPVYYAFAFSGNGMTYAGISAMIISDYILGIDNPWKEIYRTSRGSHLKALVRKGLDYTEEMVRGVIKNAATQSKKERDKLKESD